jgi:hypothetical protein
VYILASASVRTSRSAKASWFAIVQTILSLLAEGRTIVQAPEARLFSAAAGATLKRAISTPRGHRKRRLNRRLARSFSTWLAIFSTIEAFLSNRRVCQQSDPDPPRPASTNREAMQQLARGFNTLLIH